MASAPQQQFLTLENSEDVETFFLLLESKLAIEKVDKDIDKVHRLISLVGLEALKKIRKICLPKDITGLTYKELKEKITGYVKPTTKLVWAERTKFFGLKQEKEENINDYVSRLRSQANNCDFESLKQNENVQEAMVVNQLICGVNSKQYQEKILQNAAFKIPTVTDIKNLVENMQQINKFCETSEVLAIKKAPEKPVNFRKCSYCGNNWHSSLSQCPARKVVCRSCDVKGHFAKCCKRPANQKKKPFKRNEVHNVNDVFYVSDMNFIQSQFDFIDIKGTKVKFMIDTGATVSLLPTKVFNNLGLPLDTSNIPNLETYDGHKLNCIGTTEITITHKENTKCVKLRIVKSDKDYGLLGRDVINANEYVLSVDKTLSTIKGFEASIRLKPGSKNTFCKARRIPLALEKEVNMELDRLEARGIIEACNSFGIENASPVVWVRKKNGTLRMCPDYKVHLNQKIYTEDYPLPTPNSIFSKLAGAKYFSSIDLKDAYWQISIDEESQNLCAINTSKGLYKVKRLQMGLKNSAAIFQNVMENIVLKGLNNVITYQDDLIIFASTEASLNKHFNAVVGRLKSKGVTINETKTVKCVQEIEYLGRIINSDGIRPNTSHLKKALSIRPPENKRDIQSIMGFFNFFREFIKKFSEKTLFLTDKLSAEQFTWTNEDESQLSQVKEELLKEPVLAKYDVKQEVTIETDASKRAVAAIVTQNKRPIAYLSKKLQPAQSNWSNIEREAYAIYWAIIKLRTLLLGRNFTVKTDHRPLQFIFADNKGIPTRTSARISRWALELMPFDFSIAYKPGESLPHVDMLSRFSCNEENDTIFEFDELDIPFSDSSIRSDIKSFASTNEQYKRLVDRIQNNNWCKYNQLDRKFFKYRYHLTVEDTLIFNGTKLYIPDEFQSTVLQKAHETHQGSQAMTNQLKSEFWWPNLSFDIIVFLKRCRACAEKRPVNKSLLGTWPQSERWERIHIDWAFPPGFGTIFIAVDAGTNFIDAIPCSDRSIYSVKKCLSRLFGLFGVPKVIVADNAPEFIATREWLSVMGIKLINTPPYNPASNGQAERAVKTIKEALKCYEPKIGDRFIFLQKILLNHRACSGKVSPAERLYNFRPRTAVNLNFAPGQEMILKNPKLKTTDPVKYLVQKGNNTAWVDKNSRTILASLSQLEPILGHTQTELQTKKNWRSQRNKSKPTKLTYDGEANVIKYTKKK